MTSAVYSTRWTESLAAVAAHEWDELLAQQAQPTPFMRHAYLNALQSSGSAITETGWQPRYLLLEDSQGLAGAAALYLKAHSYGEYVFDWAWAEAYQRHGLRYYPKLLCAVPFTPVQGSRLLARDGAARIALVTAIQALAEAEGMSSAHVLFSDAADQLALQAAGWMTRRGVQFHWSQPQTQALTSFDELLASLQRHKRKNILQERRRVAEAGVHFEVLEGAQISEADWDYFYRCYTLTYAARGSRPYLHRRFFEIMAEQLTQHWLMFVAWQGSSRVASSLVAVDRSRSTAFGRYWGCTHAIAHLHFEACYYQPLQWCLSNGIRRFEGGAQGEHKMARGLLPVPTYSAHWLADGRFARAVDDFLAREGQGVAEYIDELVERNPFKPPASPAS